MKKKITTKNGGKGKQVVVLIAIAATAIAIVAGIGFTAAFKKLKRTYELQCCITDTGEQVEVITGKIVPARLIINHFGLTNGMNLAHVPFAELRDRLIKDTPNLRDIKITRTLPNKVRVVTTTWFTGTSALIIRILKTVYLSKATVCPLITSQTLSTTI